jgi:TatD DNase family protein
MAHASEKPSVKSVWRTPLQEDQRRKELESTSNLVVAKPAVVEANVAKDTSDDYSYLVDIGANLAHKKFNHDFDEVLARSLEANVSKILVTGTSVQSSKRAIELARKYPNFLYATVGIHPHDAKNADENAWVEMRKCIQENKIEVKALGECGLDFDRNFSTPAEQVRAFRNQLELACQLGLPVFLHERSAHDEFVKILSEYRARLCAAVVHCFTGTQEELLDYLNMDLHIGITGWICDDRRGRELRKIVKLIPWNRLMIET